VIPATIPSLLLTIIDSRPVGEAASELSTAADPLDPAGNAQRLRIGVRLVGSSLSRTVSCGGGISCPSKRENRTFKNGLVAALRRSLSTDERGKGSAETAKLPEIPWGTIWWRDCAMKAA